MLTDNYSFLTQVLNFFLNFHSLRISIINVSILAFYQVLLNEYDDDDDDVDAFKQANTSYIVGCSSALCVC